MTPDPMLFMHVPKTGGTSLTSLIESHYSVDQIMPRNYFGNDWIATKAVEDAASDIERFALLRGHYNAEVCKFAGPGRFRFTMLRDPVQRVMSLWQDWRTKSDENLATAIPQAKELILFCREHTLEELLDSDLWMMQRHFHNGMTGQFTGWPERFDESDLDNALRTLAKFDLIGTTERMDDSMRALCAAMGWNAPANAPRLNTRREDKRVDPALEAKIRECNRFDLRLYEIARAWSDRQLDRPASRVPARRRTARPARHVRVTMDGPEPGTGWHVREGLGGPRVWRWTGPGRASTVDLDLAPHTEFSLEIRVISVIDQEILDGAQLFLDGVPLSWEHAGVDDGEQIMRAQVAESDQRRARLTIVVPRTISHAEVQPETEDERQKGLAVTSVVLAVSGDDSASLPTKAPYGLKVLHHHIMKTGGTTINAMLDAVFDEDRIMPADIGRRLRESYQEEHGTETPYHFWAFAPLQQLYDRYDLIHDHKNFLPRISKDFFVFGMFREPLKRLQSLVRDWRRLPDDAIQNDAPPIRQLKLRARDLNAAGVARLADHPSVQAFVRNGMAKSLLSDVIPNAVMNAMPDEQLLWNASQKLERFDFLGLSERLPESVAMLFDRLQIRRPESIPQLNSTRPSELDQLSDSEVEYLQDANRVDMKLYELIQTRFEQQLAETDPSVLQPITEASSSSHAESKPTSDSVAETSSTL